MGSVGRQHCVLPDTSVRTDCGTRWPKPKPAPAARSEAAARTRAGRPRALPRAELTSHCVDCIVQVFEIPSLSLLRGNKMWLVLKAEPRRLCCGPQAVQLLSRLTSSIPSQYERGRLALCWGESEAVPPSAPRAGQGAGTAAPPRALLTGRCRESWCRRGKGAHWVGSMGQLDTEMSLAFPESTMGSLMLLELVSHS